MPKLAHALVLLAPLSIAVVAQFAGGCGSDETAPHAVLSQGCLINSDCSSPLVCAFQRCHSQCRDDRDCSASQRCVLAVSPNRVCQLPDETKCSYNSECPGDEVCGIDSKCRDQCAADRDCVPGQSCATGTCAAPEELVDGGLPQTNTMQITGQPCSYTSECPDGLVCHDGICNYECLGDADCAPFTCNADRRCERPDAAVIYCVPGLQVACGCVSGQGVQVCLPDGSGYGPCEGCPDGG